MNSIGKNRPSMRVWVKPSATFPPFAQPMVVSYFSLDQDRRFTPDISQLRYMHLPRDSEDLGWDLNHGIDKVQRADHAKSTERIDNLLRGILASGLSVSQEVASFMCFRGLLTRVMTTPYEQNQGWEILVSKFRGVLFMCAQETPEQRRDRMSRDEYQKRFSAWGFKFEQYMTTDQPGCPPEIDMPVKEGEEFCCLFRTKLNDRRLLYGAEMDAVTSDVPLEDCLEDLMLAQFIELKTNRKLECVRQERNFKRFKLLNWWAQNFLVNVAHIICGFRDDRGIVENIDFYKVDEIPKMARDLWVPAVCMTFLDQFLHFVGKTVWECPQSNDPHTVWRFRWEPGVHYVTGDVISGRSQFSFLPDWFLSTVTVRESHPLDNCIRVFSSRHGKSVCRDDQRMHTAKIFAMTKDIAEQRAKSKRPPSPRSIFLAQRSSKAPLKQITNSSAQPASVAIPQSEGSLNQPVVSPTHSANSNQSTPDKPPQTSLSHSSKVVSNQTSNSNSTQNTNGPSKVPSRKQRRRARDEAASHRYPAVKPAGSQQVASVKKQSMPATPHLRKNVPSPRSRTMQRSESTSSQVSSSSVLTIDTSPEHLNAVSSEQSSFSPSDLPSSSLAHTEDVVYTSYGALEDGTYLVPATAGDLSPSDSADQYAAQTFLTPSSPGDAYSQHTLLSSSLSSSSLTPLPDCYSSHSFSVCEDLPHGSYLVTSEADFLNEQSYIQPSESEMNASDRSYLPSPSAVEYISQPSFMPVTTTDDVDVPGAYLNETSDDIPSSSMLSSVTSISQTFLSSNSSISSDDIQTAEGSLTSINQLSSSAYLPSSSSANHLTLQM